MEKIIHFTVPEKLTPMQVDTIERARALHPTWEVKVWQDPIQPNGYLLEKYWSKANSGAQLSDLLRIDILYKWGGVYVDGDMRLLKPLDDLIEQLDFFVASETGNSLEGAIIGARKAHPAIKAVIDELLLNEPDWSLSPDRTTGPDLFARVLRWDKGVTVLPRETFYCYPAEADSRKTHRHSYGEHLWAYSWKELNRHPIAAPTRRNSVVDRLISIVKRLIKPALVIVFRTWRKIKSVDRSTSGQLIHSQQPRFYAVCDEIVLKTVHGFDMIVDGHDSSLTPELVFNGCYESREENFFKQILRGGDWAIDVGSNVGSFSLLAAQSVRSFGRVFAYEPNPSVLKLLSRSVVMNWMHDRVTLRPVAVGETEGSVRLTFTPERLGDAQVGYETIVNSTFAETLKTLGRDNLSVIDVPCVSLDQEFPIDLPIKLLKIDVEGHESAVLRGARRLLKHRCIDFILIEVFREVAGSRWNELLVQLNLLTECNYVACTLATDGTLISHNNVKTALDKLDGRNLVLVAKDPYIFDN